MQLKDIKKLITNTPMVEIKYKFKNNIHSVFSKCEWFSLTGNIKDKVAYQILNNAYKSKLLKKGDKIVEVTSGNMGISLCALANLLHNPVTIIMPKGMSIERKKLLKLYGATLIEVNNFSEAFSICEKYVKEGYFYTRQFENDSNFEAHYTITAPEIYNKIKNKNVDSFLAGVGTSGTLSGVGTFLKKKMNAKIYAIEPSNARILSNTPPFLSHSIQGISDEIVPKLYNKKLVDRIIQINDQDAIKMSQKLCKELSLGVGISSGANFLGSVLLDTNVATIFPDDNKKYLSTDLQNEIKSELVDKIELLGYSVI